MKPVFVFMSTLLLSATLLLIGHHIAAEGSARTDNSKKEITMPGNQTAKKNKEAVRMLYEEILNTGKFDLLNHFVAENYTGVSGQKGPAAFAEPIKPLRQGFPDIRWTVEDLVAEGDRVAVRWFWRGKHTGPFRGFAASQNQVTNSGAAIFKFRDGKIVQSWIEIDRLGFLQQIGVVPKDLTPPPQPWKIGNRNHE